MNVEQLITASTVPCPLLVVDVPPDIYSSHDSSSSDVIYNNLLSPSSSYRDLYEAPPSSSSTHAQESVPQAPPLATSARGILQDMFLSRHVTGMRASIFNCSVDHLRKVCLLHGLNINPSSTTRDVKLCLLYHIINGNCFAQRCEPCRPCPDRSACLCVASGLSITSFIMNLLNDSTPSQITTEDLLLIMQSMGDQSPYNIKGQLHRRVFASLQAFLFHCRRRAQRQIIDHTNDPFGDLFMGFEGKQKPVLESIMNHHGLLLNRESKLSSEDMRNTIVSHIALGHCIRPKGNPRPWIAHNTANHASSSHDQVNETKDAACEDFVRAATLDQEDPVGNEIKLINKILEKSPSRKLLIRFLQCKDIPHDPSQSRRSLRTTLTRFGRLLEKRCIRQQSSMTCTSNWPSVVPHTLKDKIAENFRSEISHERLQRFVCCSCSALTFLQQRVTYRKSCLDLSCLQHPEMRLSGISPDLSNMKNINLDASSLAQGLLLDQRGIENDTLSFCKDCSSCIQKRKTPPLSLANHLLLGDVPPELQNLTVVEESMIARCRAKTCIIQLKADDSDIVLPNTQRGMWGHIVIYPQQPDALLNVLPPSVQDVCTPICVVFIGSQRPTQSWLRQHATPLIVRQERIRSALLWLKANNELYRNVILDEHSLDAFPINDVLPVHIEVVNEADAGAVLTSRYDVPQTLFADHESETHNETIFDSVVVTGLATDATVNQMRAAAMMHMKTKGGGFLQIPHSNKPANEFYNPDLLPLTYPTLFPYGLGGFENLQCSASLSFKRQVKHFFSLADRRFQEHYSFLFTVFNILQRRAILLQTSLKVKRSSFDFFAREFRDISSEAIRNVCEHLSQGNDT